IIRRPPRSTLSSSSAASDVYKRQIVGETTLIPLITVSFGCGTGGGTVNSLKDGEGTGVGLGAGAKITPTAILVIKDGNVTMLSIKGKGNLENLVQMVP